MLPRLNDPAIQSQLIDLPVPGGCLRVKVLSKPNGGSGRTALYIHGGGGGGNHTLIERPSRRLITEGYFDRVILPDRRGEGGSSPMDHAMTIAEHAADMRALLDGLQVTGPITAMGISYGGPIALALAHADRRVERVVLVASSPTLTQVNGLMKVMLKTGLLKTMVRKMLKSNLGKLPPAEVDFDPAYDAKKPADLMRIFTDALKHTPVEYMDSLTMAQEATLDPANAGIAPEVRVDVPVLQIIGQGDEVWGTSVPAELRPRFPHWTSYTVPGAKIHKDVFLKPLAFYEKLTQALSENV